MCVIPSLTQDLTSQKERHIINNSSLNLRFLLCVSEIQRVASGAFALVLSYPQPSHPTGNLESNSFAAIELSVPHYLKEMDYLTLQGYFSNHTKKKVYLTPISLYPGLHTLCDSISMMASPVFPTLFRGGEIIWTSCWTMKVISLSFILCGCRLMLTCILSY